MKCKVVHETGGSLRVKILGRQLSYKEYEALHGLLEKTKGVQRIRTYWATGSIALNFRGDRERLLATIRGISEEDLAAAVVENLTPPSPPRLPPSPARGRPSRALSPTVTGGRTACFV